MTRMTREEIIDHLRKLEEIPEVKEYIALKDMLDMMDDDVDLDYRDRYYDE